MNLTKQSVFTSVPGSCQVSLPTGGVAGLERVFTRLPTNRKKYLMLVVIFLLLGCKESKAQGRLLCLGWALHKSSRREKLHCRFWFSLTASASIFSPASFLCKRTGAVSRTCLPFWLQDSWSAVFNCKKAVVPRTPYWVKGNKSVKCHEKTGISLSLQGLLPPISKAKKKWNFIFGFWKLF